MPGYVQLHSPMTQVCLILLTFSGITCYSSNKGNVIFLPWAVMVIAAFKCSLSEKNMLHAYI